MRQSAPLLRTLLAALALCAGLAAHAQAQSPAEDDDRAVTPAPPPIVRHVLIKATGRGHTAGEAEKDAMSAARTLAAQRYAALGGVAALDPSPQAERLLAVHHSPPIGFAEVRAVALVELRLRPLPEPPPSGPGSSIRLPVLSASAPAGMIQVEANLPCEVLVAVERPGGQAPDVLPGGGGAAWRLAPGRPLRQPLPAQDPASRLHILACTGGLNAPAAAATIEEILSKARAGKPRPAVVQGIVSECVQTRLTFGPGGIRSMRQKAPESPVDMTGAAGRESGLPVPGNQP